MAVSAFVVRVPEAEACVASLRERFDSSARLGVPAHITVLAPFMAARHIDAEVLREVQLALGESRPFSFKLTRAARFAEAAYLAPEPAAPFIELTRRLASRFPQFPPYAGRHASIVPHLTIAQGDAGDVAAAAEELEAIMLARGHIEGHCRSVVLLENSSGRWQEMRSFQLLESAS